MPGKSKGDDSDVQRIPVPPHFKIILITVVVLCFTSVIAEVVLDVMIAKPTQNEQHALDLLDFVAKATVGAILGLIGGKAAG